MLILGILQGRKDDLLLVVNNYDQCVQFTIEEEDDNHSVPFWTLNLLDNLLTRLLPLGTLNQELQEDSYITNHFINNVKKSISS